MKNKFLLFSTFASMFTIGQAQIEFTNPNVLSSIIEPTNRNHIDTNFDGEISITEAENATYLNLFRAELTSLDDLIHFPNITELDIHGNTTLPSIIDFSPYPQLEILKIDSCNLTEINVTENVNLLEIFATGNLDLENIDLSNNINLTRFSMGAFGGHSITRELDIDNIDLSNNINLKELFLWHTTLTEIDLSNNINLELLNLNHSKIESIDLSNLNNLSILEIENTEITDLDVTNCSITSINFDRNDNLKTVLMTGQPLEYFFDENGSSIQVDLEWCPSLETICVDEEFQESILEKLEYYQSYTEDFEIPAATGNVDISDCNNNPEPLEFNDVITMFPNPTTGILNLNVIGTGFTPTLSIIFPLLGGFPTFHPHTGTNTTLDLSGLANGIYTITTTGLLGEVYTSTFVKI